METYPYRNLRYTFDTWTRSRTERQKPERRRPSRVPGGSDRAARHRPTSGPSGWAAPAAVGRFHRATVRRNVASN